jgi:hypothetical protein
LLLLGDGKGGFRPAAGQNSGLLVYGEGRGAAACDFDADGRVDLAVAQNGAETRLFRNRAAKPGLRVRLAGPATNPTGIGAALRLHYGDKFGPWREVHAGAGYWSMDSPVVVLGFAAEPTALEVRWPGAILRTYPLPPGAREVQAAIDEPLKRVK